MVVSKAAAKIGGLDKWTCCEAAEDNVDKRISLRLRVDCRRDETFFTQECHNATMAALLIP